MGEDNQLTADYVIVGAGSSGCALAAHLSRHGSDRVLLLEAGGSHHHPFVAMPLGVSKTVGNPRFDWRYATAPQPSLNNRVLDYPLGRVLGGGSSINGMNFVRGWQSDFDGWRDAGCAGWDGASMLPYFDQMEDFLGDDAGRKKGGPLKITPRPHWHPLSSRLIKASVTAGLPATEDYNRPNPAGLAPTQFTVGHGRRCSAAAAYLDPALRRENLKVMTHAEAVRILFTDGKASGVEFRRNGRLETVRAAREVIVSAGAIGTPVLLERSGIGNGHHLKSLGLPVVHHSANVGENLQDHVVSWVRLRLKNTTSLNEETRGLRLLRHIFHYALTRKGFLAGTPVEVTGYARVSPGDGPSDILLHGVPMTYSYALSPEGKPIVGVDREPGISLAFFPCRPESRGQVHAAAPSLGAPPVINPNFLHADHDRKIVIAGLRLCRRIFQQPVFEGIRDVELGPGPDVESDDELLAYARMSSHSGYHPVGTCRMGSDEAAVLDPQLRVKGVGGLRVADASIMPKITSANTNATAIAIGLKAADIIGGKQ